MKKILSLLTFVFAALQLNAQETPAPTVKIEKPKIDVRKKAEDRTQQAKEHTATSVVNKPAERIEAAADKVIDKALDQIQGGIINVFKKKNNNPDSLNNKKQSSQPTATKDSPTNEPNQTVNSPTTANGVGEQMEETAEVKVVTKNTFKRGSSIIFEDDFAKDAAGDFPAQWNTAKGGEIVEMQNKTPKWLKISNKDKVFPEFKKTLPENFTIEFDAIMPNKDVDFEVKFSDGMQYGGYIYFTYNSRVTNGIRQYVLHQAIDGMSSVSRSEIEEKGTAVANKPLHFAFEVNGKRVRWYINDVKKIDLPTAFLPNYRNKWSIEPTPGAGSNFESMVYLSNVVIAETTTDARSTILKELLEKGSFSTNAILFESNSYTLKGNSSDAVIASIAQALNEDKRVQLKIVGHTDNVGVVPKNEILSLNRANSIKNELINKYGIESNRLSTEGKGSAIPIADNATEQGKSLNRRVEFVVVKN